MKYKLIAVMLVLASLNLSAQKLKLSSVQIEWQDFATSTTVNVDCDSFRKTFKQTIQKQCFNDKASLDKYSSLTKYFIEKKEDLIDVRGMIIFKYQRKKVEYCFDKFGMFYKNGKYFYNRRLIDFISKQLKL